MLVCDRLGHNIEGWTYHCTWRKTILFCFCNRVWFTPHCWLCNPSSSSVTWHPRWPLVLTHLHSLSFFKVFWEFSWHKGPLLKYLYVESIALHFGDFLCNSLSVSLNPCDVSAQNNTYQEVINIFNSGFKPPISKISTFSFQKIRLTCTL